MENQINTGDQNNQQIGQSPINQTPVTSDKPKINYWMISTLVLSLVLIVGAFFSIRLLTRNNKQKPDTRLSLDQRVSPTPKENETIPTTTPVVPPITQGLNNLSYLSSNLKFGFNYPKKTWQIKTINLSKGQEYKDGEEKYTIKTDDTGEEKIQTFYRIQAKAVEGDTEFIVLTKNKDWQLTIKANKDFVKNQCGGETMLKNGFNEKFYKKLTMANRTVVRPLFEEGNLRTVPGPAGSEKIPFAQMIQDKKEYINQAKVSIIELPFCIEIQEIPLKLVIEYHSTFFTSDNFYTKKTYTQNIDAEILKEMDGIIESISFQ